MKLYTTTLAPNPRRVRIFMEEKGIEIPVQEISIMEGEHKEEEYKKISPSSKVPALELDDGTVITERIDVSGDIYQSGVLIDTGTFALKADTGSFITSIEGTSTNLALTGHVLSGYINNVSGNVMNTGANLSGWIADISGKTVYKTETGIFPTGTGVVNYLAKWTGEIDGAGRVLFEKGSGSELGVLVPIIEILEGGWPWILLWPIGFLWACLSLNTRWGVWALSTQIIILGSILPLKMQLPWYIHPFWLPFALVCGPPVSWLIQREENSYIFARTILRKIPYTFSLIGLCIFTFSVLLKLKILNFEQGYFYTIFFISLAWFIGGLLLSNSRKNIRKIGFIGLIVGSIIGLFFFVSSKFWLWEINENWDVRPVAEFIDLSLIHI